MRLTLLKFCLFRFIHEGQARCERLFRHHLVVYYAYWMEFCISVVFSAHGSMLLFWCGRIALMLGSHGFV